MLLELAYFINPQLCFGQNYSNYHQSIIEIENLIIEQDFNKALDQFDVVFSSFDFVFLRDYQVAAQLAAYLGDSTQTFEYLRLAIASGWKLRDIKRINIFSGYKKEAAWKVIENQFDSIQIVYQNSLKLSIRDQVHQLYKSDQRLAIGALFRIGQKAQNRYAVRKFAPNNEKQLEVLERIMIEYGYPGEQLIGNDFWVSTILCHHNSISKEYVSKDTLYQQLRPLLLRGLEKGEISPFEFALIEDWKNAVMDGYASTIYGFLGADLNDQTKLKIDSLRAVIGLRSVDLRNSLVDIQQETGIDFYLPGKPWQDGKINVSGN
ncbi:MAG: hypothetical protein ABJH98_03730 [Reichenbachiella sp.]|uniref:hypothetical protein n=1 Tax=Reichenbachiella sp. TaxID=2184521 RepID=UPI00329699E2